MHIVKLLTKINETGLTTNTLDLTEAFIRKGHQVTVFIGRSNYYNKELKYLENRFENSGANIIWYDNIYQSTTLKRIKFILKLMLKVKSINCDIIHSQSPYLSFIPWILNKKFVSTIHVADLPKRFAYKNATRVIAISEETKEYAINHFNYNPSKIDMVFHGVSNRYQKSISESEKAKLKVKLNIDHQEIIIGIVASIEKRKGHDLLLKAVQNFKNKELKFKVLIVGSYKSEHEKGWLEEIINDTGTKDDIVLVPYQDPKPFYDIIDIFVLPSRLEGFPLVAIEAFLSNCCVIRSNVEGAKDQINHGITGFLFENGNYKELSKMLEMLIINKSLRIKIASEGRQFALNNFTSDIMADNTLKVYEKVISL